jgi:predicted N-acetyltransferase YhbS
MDVIRLSTADYDEAIDFLNLVFSQAHEPHDFPRLLPKIYQPDDRLMRCNLAVRLNGRIRAVVGVFPMDIQIGSQRLHANGIGGVATHSNDRGSGLMRLLMETAVASMPAEGMVLSALGGNRQRYGHFGYEKAGTQFNYTLTRTNARHFLGSQTEPSYRLLPLNQAEPAADLLHKMQSWHDAQPIHICRPQSEFLTILASWQAKTWVALDPDGQAAGYLVVSRDGQTVLEMLTARPDQLLPVAAAWVLQQPAETIRLIVPPWALSAIRQFGQISERWDTSFAYNLKIISWPAVLSSLLSLKARQDSLLDGHLSIRINRPESSVVVRIRVDGDQADCVSDPESARADLTLDAAAATRLLLGPQTPGQTLPEYDQLETSCRHLLVSWFPLPFFWPFPDQV